MHVIEIGQRCRGRKWLQAAKRQPKLALEQLWKYVKRHRDFTPVLLAIHGDFQVTHNDSTEKFARSIKFRILRNAIGLEELWRPQTKRARDPGEWNYQCSVGLKQLVGPQFANHVFWQIVTSQEQTDFNVAGASIDFQDCTIYSLDVCSLGTFLERRIDNSSHPWSKERVIRSN